MYRQEGNCPVGKKGGRGIVRGGKKTRGELSRYLIINLSCLEQPETEL